MTTKTQDYIIQEVREGDVLVFSKNQDLPQNSTEYYFIENPAGDDLVEIEDIQVVAGTKTDVRIHYNVSQDSSGTAMPVINGRVGAEEDKGLTREYGGSYSDLDSKPFEDVVPGGEGGNGGRSNVVGGRIQGFGIVIPPGENILIEAENTSSSDGYVAPRFVANID